MFHVVEKYRRQGLGSHLTKEFARKVAGTGIDLVVSIYPDNLVSTKIFQSLGFKKFGEDVRMKIEKITNSS